MRATHLARRLVVLAALGSAPLAAASESSILGHAGEVFRLRAGVCGDLFPAGGVCPVDHAVLALDVQRPGQVPERLLVPATEDLWAEATPSILYEDASARLFLVWEGWWNGIHPQLNLVSFGDEGWSDVLEISGQPFAVKSFPRLAVTRDEYTVPAQDGSRVTRHRTVIHVVWRESLSETSEVVRYAPLVLEDGVFIGENEVHTLDDFIELAADTAPGAAGALRKALEIRSGKRSDSVVVGFGSAAGDLLHTLTLQILPGEFSYLAEQIRLWLVERFATAAGPLNAQGLAAELRVALLEMGAGLNPAVVEYLSAQLETFILTLDLSDLDGAPDLARHQMIEIGARLVGGSLMSESDFARHQMIEIGHHLTTGDPVPVRHDGLVRPEATWPLPVAGASEVRAFFSASGANALVAWEEAESIRYRETHGAAWSDVRSLALGPQLSRDAAFDILEQRIEDR